MGSLSKKVYVKHPIQSLAHGIAPGQFSPLLVFSQHLWRNRTETVQLLIFVLCLLCLPPAIFAERWLDGLNSKINSHKCWLLHPTSYLLFFPPPTHTPMHAHTHLHTLNSNSGTHAQLRKVSFLCQSHQDTVCLYKLLQPSWVVWACSFYYMSSRPQVCVLHCAYY